MLYKKNCSADLALKENGFLDNIGLIRNTTILLLGWAAAKAGTRYKINFLTENVYFKTESDTNSNDVVQINFNRPTGWAANLRISFQEQAYDINNCTPYGFEYKLINFETGKISRLWKVVKTPSDIFQVYCNNKLVVNLDLTEKVDCLMRVEVTQLYLHSSDTATTEIYIGEGSCIFSMIKPK